MTTRRTLTVVLLVLVCCLLLTVSPRQASSTQYYANNGHCNVSGNVCTTCNIYNDGSYCRAAKCTGNNSSVTFCEYEANTNHFCMMEGTDLYQECVGCTRWICTVVTGGTACVNCACAETGGEDFGDADVHRLSACWDNTP